MDYEYLLKAIKIDMISFHQPEQAGHWQVSMEPWLKSIKSHTGIILLLLTLKVPEKLQLYELYVYYMVHICDFGMLRVKEDFTLYHNIKPFYDLYFNQKRRNLHNDSQTEFEWNSNVGISSFVVHFFLLTMDFIDALWNSTEKLLLHRKSLAWKSTLGIFFNAQ